MALYNNRLILQWITFIVYPICLKPQEQRVLVVVSLTRDSSSDLCNNKNSFNIKPGTKEVCLQNDLLFTNGMTSYYFKVDVS